MRASELRIGNIIHIDYIFNQYEDSITNLNDDLSNYEEDDLTKIIKDVTVKQIRDSELVVSSELVVFDIGHFKPIPLTEEWLVRLSLDEYKMRDMGLEKTNDNKWAVFLTGKIIGNVHSIQNYYHALTGGELSI